MICSCSILKNVIVLVGRGDRILDSRRSLSPAAFEDSRTKEVLSAEIHCYEFFRMVIDLLRNLCGAELNGVSAVTANGRQHISLQAVNFALENLCTLQFGGTTNISLVTTQVAELKAAMTRLLLTALEKVFEFFLQPNISLDSVITLKYTYLKT